MVIAGSGSAEVMVTLTAPGERQHGYRGWVCPCTPAGGVELARWNGEAAHRWNRLRQALERAWACRIEYFRASEVQERGAIHFHVLIRTDRPVKMHQSKVRALAMRHGFGHEVDLAPVTDTRAARYCAKYVAKASGERQTVPYVHRVTGEIGPGRWRTWSSSRHWGATMAGVRAAQARWAQAAAAGTDPAPAGWGPQGPLDTNTQRYTSAAIDDRYGGWRARNMAALRSGKMPPAREIEIQEALRRIQERFT